MALMFKRPQIRGLYYFLFNKKVSVGFSSMRHPQLPSHSWPKPFISDTLTCEPQALAALLTFPMWFFTSLGARGCQRLFLRGTKTLKSESCVIQEEMAVDHYYTSQESLIYRVAVKELELSYYNKETLFSTIDPGYSNLSHEP